MGLTANEKRNEVVKASLPQAFQLLKKLILVLESVYKKVGFVPKLLSFMSSRGLSIDSKMLCVVNIYLPATEKWIRSV